MDRCFHFMLFVGICHALPWKDITEFANVGMAPGKFPKGQKAESGELRGRPGVFPAGSVDTKVDLFPPKWHPGDVMEDETDMQEVSVALDDVLRAGDIMQDRRCAIGTANLGDKPLANPQWWIYSGMIQSSAPISIEPLDTGFKLFVKTSWTLQGTVGIVSYDIEDSEYKLVIMWSVPFDLNLYNMWYLTKIYPKSVATNGDLWDQMYYYAGPWRTSGYHSKSEYGVNMLSTMTENIHSKLTVQMDTSQLDASGEPDLHTDCSYHAGWFGKYCWQECSMGWCWVNKKCSSQSDCQGDGPLTCYTGC